jgi:hypothetical protein
VLLFALAAGLYLLTRLVSLEQFPIYFFSDEAILVNSAQELLDNGLRTSSGTFLPTYMKNADRWNLGLPVYLHLASLALLGKSVFVARLTSVLVGLVGALAVSAALRQVFQTRFWWSGVLALTVMPAWFIHSRTAFDPVMMAAFYACFLTAYLLYRCRSPRYLYLVVLFAAMTAYSYPNGQPVVLLSVGLLLLSDLRFHLRQPPRLLLGVGLLALVLLLPLLRFRLEQPGAWEEQLQVVRSYMVQPLPWQEKAVTFLRLYLQGLSPAYWFFPNEADWVRHRWYGLGHLGQHLLPLIAAGLWASLRRWRSPAHRAVLIAVLAAPAGAALLKIEVTRVMAMVVPAALLAALGLEQIFTWLRLFNEKLSYPRFALAAAGVFILAGLSMLNGALRFGPIWFQEYGLYGMQYGARQVFGAVRQELAGNPERRVFVSHTWANNANAFVPFFIPKTDEPRVNTSTLEPFQLARQEIGPDWTFVLTAEEHAAARQDGKLILQPPHLVLLYPNGQPGFYFVRLAYSPDFESILEAERQVRRQLVDGQAELLGQTVQVRHSPIDLGGPQDLFDGRKETLMRGVEANPLVLELTFPQPVELSAVRLHGWSPNIELTAALTGPSGEVQTFSAEFRQDHPDPLVELLLDGGPHLVQVLRLEIGNLGAGEVAKVHIREISLIP